MSKLLKFFSENKKTIFFATSLGVVLFFLFWTPAEAEPTVTIPRCSAAYDLCEGCSAGIRGFYKCIFCVLAYIISLPIRIAIATMVVYFGLGAIIAGLIYGIIVAIVTWLISIIMTIGIVPGAGNTPNVVEMGWDFTRQFANLFFLVALAFIGLATILRIKEYEAKKALPTLIIIALLINFTPVIVGFIVDMGNIITFFFLNQVGTLSGFASIMLAAFDYILCGILHIFLRDGVWWNDFFVIIGEFIGIIIYGVVLFIFFIMAGFAYLLVGTVLFFRTIFLWILMILSPIAFLSKIFPQGRTTKMIFPDILHWDKWWEKLIQWTIIGIPIGFFLYLSNLIITDSAGIQNALSSGALETGIMDFEDNASSTLGIRFQAAMSTLIVNLLAPVVGLVVLVMGMMISFKAAPEGAKGIMRMTTQGGIKRGWGGMKATAGKFKHHYDSARADKMGAFKATGVALTQTTKETAKDAKSRISGWGKKVASGGGFGTGPTPSSGGGTGTGRGGGGGADGGADGGGGGGTGGGGGGTGGGGGASPPLGPGSPSPTLDPNEYFDQTADQTQATTPTSPLGPGSPSPTLDPNEYFDQTADQTQPPAPPSASAPAPAAPTPPSTTRKQKAKKVAKWMFPNAAKFGWNLGKGVSLSLFKSLEPIITDQIDKEMGIGKHKKSGGDQKTINCTICSEKIKGDSNFCSKCGNKQL